ncbi:MAG: response regulator, partial [bacterium]|nr:response regulator [bacterium]
MGRPISVLLVEDSEDDAALILLALRRSGFDVTSERVDTAPELSEALERRAWDIVLSDYSMPSLNGLDALRISRDSGRWCPFIIVSGAIGEELAVELMRNGAHDCIMKDKLSRLLPAVERELEEAMMRREREEALESLRRELKLNATLADLARNLIAVPGDIDAVAGHVLKYATELTGSGYGSVSLVDPRTGMVTKVRSSGSEGAQGERLSVPVVSGDSVVGEIAIADPARGYASQDLTAIGRLSDLFSIAIANYRTLVEKDELSLRLRRVQKVEAIGTLAGGIAHDFNNILAPMIGYPQMVQMCLS